MADVAPGSSETETANPGRKASANGQRGAWDESAERMPGKASARHPAVGLAMSVAMSVNSGQAATEATSSESVRVLTFNIAEDGKFGLPGVVDLIRQSKADVVGLQEADKNTPKIAQALGFNYVLHGDTAILTRFKIDAETPGGAGVTLHTDSGKRFAFFDAHLYYKPYQPYQLRGIPYENGKFIHTAAEAVKEAKNARGADVAQVRKDIASLSDKNLPTILVGDFNEPSYLDWTTRAAKAGRNPVSVQWPATKAFAHDGFKDSYRMLYPNEIKHPGFTWSPKSKPNDRLDPQERIDYILHRGKGIKLKSVEIIGENKHIASVVVSPFPSDHRAVMAVYDLGGAKK